LIDYPQAFVPDRQKQVLVLIFIKPPMRALQIIGQLRVVGG